MNKALLLACTLTTLVAGCGPTAETTTSVESDHSATTKAPADFVNAEGKLVCPVMGNVIDKKEDAVGFQDYEGKRYYFCCGGCPEKFKAEPAKYAVK